MKANKKFIQDDSALSNLVPLALAIIITFAILFIGGFVNGQISQSLLDTYPAAASRTHLQNRSVNAQNNISANWDSSLSIVQVVVIISLLAAAIGAIFIFTRFR